MENYEEDKNTKLCITCNEEKDIKKFLGRNCISCRNKKYYKKDYFKKYYEINGEVIKNQAILRYETIEKLNHTRTIGRPRKLVKPII